MSIWKSMLLGLYYYTSCPVRALDRAWNAAAGRAPVIVLFYHRIAEDRDNAWTTRYRTFERQIRWLQKQFPLVSLAEAHARLLSGTNNEPCVSITFDDGYADNCEAALPLLLEGGIPFTYFVSTRSVLEGEPFPHDVALGRPLRPNTPQQIRQLAELGVEIGAHTRTHADLGQIDDPARLHDEIVVARDELQAMTQRPVRYFAFPFGQHRNLSAAAFETAHRAGYEAVCSAYGGFNFPGDDAFHLQRIHVDDDLVRLKNWVSVDPRKLRATKRFEYQSVVRLPGVFSA